MRACWCSPPGYAFADETWLCEDENRHRYKVSQNVPSDSCRKLRADQVNLDPATIPLAARAPRTWTVDRLCRSRKVGTCAVTNQAVDWGTLNGVPFKLFADGATVAGESGLTQEDVEADSSWSVFCSRDAMSGMRACVVNRHHLYISITSNGGTRVSVGSNHFPGSQTSLKIGARRHDTRSDGGYFGNAPGVVASLRDDVPVVTRYMEWPERTWVDHEFTSFGAAAAMQLAHWLVQHGELK